MNINQLTKKELTEIILLNSQNTDKEILDAALAEKKKHYSDKIYLRGLIEFTNICKNNCFYCGIRAENNNVTRYRLSKDEICRFIGADSLEYMVVEDFQEMVGGLLICKACFDNNYPV